MKKMFLENLQNLQENACARVSFLIRLQAPDPTPAPLLKKNTLTQVLSCEISKNTSSYRTPLVAASDIPAVYTQRLEASGFHC